MKHLRVAIIVLPLIACSCNERAPRATKQQDDSGVVSTNRVHTVEFGPEGKRIVIASGDGTNKVQDAQSDLDRGTSNDGRIQVFHAMGRPDIDTDIPLASAVRRANAQFPDVQPLTEEEVIAAVRAIK